MEVGAYLGDEALANGMRACISSFTRHHVNVSMTRGKISGYYVNSIMAKLQAKSDGYDEAILLDPEGYVAEGTGENVFMIRRGILKTTSLTSVLGDYEKFCDAAGSRTTHCCRRGTIYA